MAGVSLILPVVEGSGPKPAVVAGLRSALERAGHTVEVVVAARPGLTLDTAAGPWRSVTATERGRASVALAGLFHATGPLLLVLDPTDGYAPEDLVRLAAVLEEGRAELVVASRPPRGLGRLAHALTGSSDPCAGLIGLTRSALEAAASDFRAVGSQFALELLSKVRGRRLDVPAAPAGPRPSQRPGWDDLRHLKRLADHRFGNLSRLVQFCAVGASGMVVDLSFYAFFQWLFAQSILEQLRWPGLGPLDLATAAVLAVLIALTWNFILNRRMTFSDARAGSIFKQYITYALGNALAISLNLTLRLTLPRTIPFFDRHKLAAAVVGIVLATGVSFSMARWVVFRRGPARAQRLVESPGLG